VIEYRRIDPAAPRTVVPYANLLQSGHLMREGILVAATIWGVVKNGLVAPSSPLPEGALVEIRLCETPPEVPPEL
jgi:hypothetical protein